MTRCLLTAAAIGTLAGLALTFGPRGAIGIAVCAAGVIAWGLVRAVRAEREINVNRLRRWWRDRNRTSWIYCPSCRRDLNGDNESFTEERAGLAYYDCASCGFLSAFLLDPPVPVYIGGWAR